MKEGVIDVVTNHMLDIIERLKDSDDPECDPRDKISVAAAREAVNCGKVIMEGAKLKFSAAKLMAEGIIEGKELAQQGLIEDKEYN